MAGTRPKYQKLKAWLLMLFLSMCAVPGVCLAEEIFQNNTDQVRNRLNSLDRQLHPSKKSVGWPRNCIHDKWAFVVGVNKYQDKKIEPIKAARNNAMLFSTTLKESSVGHFANGHVAELVGVNATRETILGALFSSALIKKSLPSDLIVLYFSGRTIYLPGKDDICLCTYDTLLSAPERSGINLKETLASFRRRSQCSQILCILDCSPNPQPKLKEQARLAMEDLAKSTGVSFISANFLDRDSQPCGSGTISCFSQFLTEALKDSQGSISVNDLVDYIQANITQEESLGAIFKQKIIFAGSTGNDRAGEIMIGARLHGLRM